MCLVPTSGYLSKGRGDLIKLLFEKALILFEEGCDGRFLSGGCKCDVKLLSLLLLIMLLL